MPHSPAPESPPSPAGDARLVGQVLRWLVPGALLVVAAILTRGTGRIAEHTTQAPGAEGLAAGPGETQTRAVLEERIIVNNYAVTDLVPIGNGTLPNRDFFNALISLIESSI